MKKLLIALVAIAFLVGTAFAASSDTQTVYYEIDAINELTAGADVTLTINSATAGSQPSDDDAFPSPGYDITTNETGKKITAALNANMPNNTNLTTYLNPPTGAATNGEVTLDSTAQSVVYSIETVAESHLTYSVSLNATVSAGLPADGSRVITWTLTDES
ncbi:MAG: hypothetical protein ABIH00_05095 [Armatimonadota bacterium]